VLKVVGYAHRRKKNALYCGMGENRKKELVQADLKVQNVRQQDHELAARKRFFWSSLERFPHVYGSKKESPRVSGDGVYRLGPVKASQTNASYQ
jgi:hypothetical protein